MVLRQGTKCEARSMDQDQVLQELQQIFDSWPNEFLNEIRDAVRLTINLNNRGRRFLLGLLTTAVERRRAEQTESQQQSSTQ